LLLRKMIAYQILHSHGQPSDNSMLHMFTAVTTTSQTVHVVQLPGAASGRAVQRTLLRATGKQPPAITSASVALVLHCRWHLGTLLEAGMHMVALHKKVRDQLRWR
jgi:hypothetical protein